MGHGMGGAGGLGVTWGRKRTFVSAFLRFQRPPLSCQFPVELVEFFQRPY